MELFTKFVNKTLCEKHATVIKSNYEEDNSMKANKPLKRKSFGFIVQTDPVGRKKLLVYSNVPGVQFRLPGGNIDPGDTAEVALFREILEESGLTNLLMTKKLGVQYYYKAFIDSNVERHDFLIVPDRKLPEEWEYIGTGDGGDRGSKFKYQWLTKEEIHLIDEEFRRDIIKSYLEELFS